MGSSSSIEFYPNPGLEARLLFVLLHGVGGCPDNLEKLGLALRVAFPSSVVMIPEGFEVFDGGGTGRQWFSTRGVSEENRPERVAQALPALNDYVRAAQRRLKLKAADTALGGFSQGAIMALEAVQADERLAGRVLAFSGRYAALPDAAPRYTTIHLLHGADDVVMPVTHAQAAQHRLAQLQGDATIDVASRVGHELHPALVQRAIVRLQTCVPLRSWEAAMGHDQAPPPDATVH
ncbi:MAG TPA: esterase [Bordetella sp.]